MVNADVVECPLCGGFTRIKSPALLQALKSPSLRVQIERYITELLKSPVENLNSVGATHAGRDFQKDGDNWDPCVPMWRRSPNE